MRPGRRRDTGFDDDFEPEDPQGRTVSHTRDASNRIHTMHCPDFRGFVADLFWATIGTQFHAAVACGQESQMDLVSWRTGL